MYSLESEPLSRVVFLSKEELAYRQLRSAILTKAIQPGERMVIRDLADRFGVSTFPVRQALMRLEKELLVVRLPSGGMIAAPLSIKEVEEIYAMRAALEGLAARKATRLIGENELNQLTELAMEMRQALADSDTKALIEANTRFHFIIYRAAGNDRLYDSLSNMWDVCYRYRHISYSDPNMPEKTVHDHVEFLEAMSRGDAEAAERAVVLDMENTARMLVAQLETLLSEPEDRARRNSHTTA